MDTNITVSVSIPDPEIRRLALLINQELEQLRKERLNTSSSPIFANGIAAFVITDRDSFTRESVSRDLSQMCIGIVLADKLWDGTVNLPTAKAMADSCLGGVMPQKRTEIG